MPKYNPISPIVLKESLLHLDRITPKAVQEHFKLYEGYVKKTNEIREKLLTVDKTTANQTFSDLRSLKSELSFAIGGVKNHELYFDIIGGQGGNPTGKIAEIIDAKWGSFESWKADIKATGISARGWVWMALDHSDKSFFNYLGDSQNTYPIWNATPILALDTYEHAYWMDFGSDRGSYIEYYFTIIDWEAVNKRIEGLSL